VLKLDDSSAFTGQVSGLAGPDTLDLSNISYGPSTTASFIGDTDEGVLTVTNGATTANLVLLGNYTNATWSLSVDGNGGTRVVATLGGNVQLTINGTEVFGSNDTIDIGNGIYGNVIGNNDALSLGTNSLASVSGTGESISATDNGINVTANSQATINGAGNTVTVGASAQLTINGNTDVDGSNDTINVGAGSIVTVYGNNNTVDMTASSASTVAVDGTGDVVSGNIGSDAVGLIGAGTSATVSGTGQVGLNASDESVTLTSTGDWAVTAANTTSETISGSSDTIYVGAGSIATVNGNNNTVNMVASSTSVVALNGTGDVVSGNIGSNNVGLIGVGSSATVSGAGQVGLNASGETATLSSAGELGVTAANTTSETINGSSDTIDVGNGSVTTVAGNNDSLNLGTGSSTTVTGTGETINANNDSFTVAANSQATITGGGNQIVLGGANAQVTFTNDATAGDGVYGSNGTINVANGQYAAIYGNDNVTIGAGAGVDDIGTSATITFTGATGILAIDQPDGFTGQILGFTGTAPDPNHSDSIYLANFNESSYSVQTSGANEILTLHDAGGDVATLTFDNFSASLNVSMVGSYTLITDPPAASAAAASDDASAFGSALGRNATPSAQPQPSNGSFIPDTAATGNSATEAAGSSLATWQQSIALLSNYMATAFAPSSFGSSGAPAADTMPFIPAAATLASQQFANPQHPS
jgi:hypothetical protein